MLEKFSFGDLLRYGFSGGAFLLAMQLSRVGFDSVTSPGFEVKEGAAILLVSVLIGSFIYSLHRALFHRPINHLCNWILDRTFAGTKLANAKTYLEDTFRRDYARWIRRCNHPTFHQSMDKWASQIHFL